MMSLFMCFMLLAHAQHNDGIYYVDAAKKSIPASKVNPSFFSIGLGFSQTNLSPGDASATGLMVAMDFWGIHLDVASNFATGEGEYLDYSTSQTFTLDKQTWTAVNIGFNIPVVKKLFVTPKLGLVVIENIYQDNVGFSTYYTETVANKMQVGVDLKFVAGNVYFKAGTALTEVLNAGMGVCF